MIRISDKLPSIVHQVSKQGLRRIEQVDSGERGELRVAIAESVARELAQAYSEQTRNVANYRLTLEDVHFAERWAAWQRCKAATDSWLLTPEHAVAQAEFVSAGGVLTNCTARVRELIDSRPVQVAQVTLRDAPDGWPTQVLSWSECIEHIIASRSKARQPGEDDDAA